MCLSKTYLTLGFLCAALLWPAAVVHAQVYTQGDVNPRQEVSAPDYVGVISGGSRTATVGATGNGSLYIGSGGFANLSHLFVGTGSGAIGSVYIQGGTTSPTSNSIFGSQGVGNLYIESGAIKFSKVYFGAAENGFGYLKQTGGTLESTSTFSLGSARNATGSYHMQSGSALLQGLFLARSTSFSHGSMTISGGNVSVADITNVSDGGTGTLSVEGGVFTASILNVGTFNNGSGTLRLSNKATTTITSDFTVGNKGSLVFQLEGGNDGFNDPILNAADAGIQLSTDANYVIDLSSYAATENKTITLMSFFAVSQEVNFDIIGYDSEIYTPLTPVWDSNNLSITINYSGIPEPAHATLLVAIFVAVMAGKRRK